MADLRRELFFPPNVLTLIRILLIPLVLWFIDNESPLRSFIAALLYSASAITDFLDGYLARRYQQVSVLGKFLDPLADKISVMAALIWMIPLGRIAPWIVILLLTRELAIQSLRSIASAEGLVIAARDLGKDKTALQLVGIICLIVHFRYPMLFTSATLDFHIVGQCTIYLSLVLSIFSAIEYIGLFGDAVFRKGSNPSLAVPGGDED